MIAYTEILNVYNRKNKIRLRLSDQLAEELETLEFETEALDLEINESLEIPQFGFTFSAGLIYEF